MFNALILKKTILKCAGDVEWPTWFLMWLCHLNIVYDLWNVELWWCSINKRNGCVDYHVTKRPLFCSPPIPIFVHGHSCCWWCPLLLMWRLACAPWCSATWKLDFCPGCGPGELSLCSFFAVDWFCPQDLALNMKNSIFSFEYFDQWLAQGRFQLEPFGVHWRGDFARHRWGSCGPIFSSRCSGLSSSPGSSLGMN